MGSLEVGGGGNGRALLAAIVGEWSEAVAATARVRPCGELGYCSWLRGPASSGKPPVLST